MRRKHHQPYRGRFARLASLARFLIIRTAPGALLALATLLATPMPIQAQGNPQSEMCSGNSYNTTPTAVEVNAVPIVVNSTTADYFVLYVSHEVGGTTGEIPVLVKKGEAGTTALAENVEALPAERYRVEKYLIADPADVDGDCVDDITELNDLGAMNPVNPAADVPLNDGAVAIPDRATFETYAYAIQRRKGCFSSTSGRLGHRPPGVYFQNANTTLHQWDFLDALG